MTRITSKTTLTELRNILGGTGFGHVRHRASEIKKAALAGCLLWTDTRLTTTDASRIDVRRAE
jgi:hypothetical protein